MTNKLTSLIIFFILSQSCTEVIKTTFANRNSFVFVSEDNVKERAYFLTLEMREKEWNYNYTYDADSNKNVDLKYLNQSDILKFGSDDFIPIQGSEFRIEDLSETPFKKYKLKEPIADGIGPIIFNPGYGVLSIGNIMAPTVIFLPKKSKLEMAKEIFEITLRNNQ